MIQLRRPCSELVTSYLEMMEEFRVRGEKIWEGTVPENSESSLDFINRLLKSETVYWAIIDGLVVGRISFRAQLTDLSREFGGNIGYEVRPSARGKGVATEMLKLLLETAEAKKAGELLLTCSPENEASIKTILKNRGEFLRTAYVERMKRQTNYYLIRP